MSLFRWLRVVLSFALLCLTANASASQTVSREFFGFHAHRLGAADGKATDWPSLPFGSWRLWDANVSWPHLEPERGKWNFSRLDRYVSMAAHHRVEILLPLGLSPTWAAARPQEPSAYQRPGWASEPASLADWTNYVRTVALRYRGRVRYYEIWNEPNLTRFFSGSVEAMRDLTCAAYRTIKSVDPEALVVSPAATEMGKGVKWLQEFFERGGHECVDIVGFHFYTYAHHGPEEMVTHMRAVTALARKYGRPRIWNTETGWYFANQRVLPKTKYRIQKLDEQEGYIARAHILGAAAGIERFFWYAWDNHTMGGLVEPDSGEPKPAVSALDKTMQWLVGSHVDACDLAEGASVWICPVRDSKRGIGYLAWRVDGARRWIPPDSFGVLGYETLKGERFSLKRGESLELDAKPVLLTTTVQN